jgi:small subunit ribosomal protein S1
VQIIKINHETQRISLGMKQLQTDPWEGVSAKYPVGAKFTGKVTNVTDYGAFVELEPGVEGLVHVSEMSWVKKNLAPSKLVVPGTEVDVQVLEVDSNKRRISLGLKQTQENPWNHFTANHPAGTIIEGEVKSITEFGLFIGLDSDIDGMVHLSDLSWSVTGEEAIKAYEKGQMVKAQVLDIDVEKERVSLGIKQLEEGGKAEKKSGGASSSASTSSGGATKKNQVVTGTVTEVNDGGIEVELEGGMRSFIRRADLARDRNDQRPDRFGKGDKVDAMVTSVDKATRKVSLSIKAKEVAEEKEAVAQFGSSDSGASLGDILGAALKKKTKKGDE